MDRRGGDTIILSAAVVILSFPFLFPAVFEQIFFEKSHFDCDPGYPPQIKFGNLFRKCRCRRVIY